MSPESVACLRLRAIACSRHAIASTARPLLPGPRPPAARASTWPSITRTSAAGRPRAGIARRSRSTVVTDRHGVAGRQPPQRAVVGRQPPPGPARRRDRHRRHIPARVPGRQPHEQLALGVRHVAPAEHAGPHDLVQVNRAPAGVVRVGRRPHVNPLGLDWQIALDAAGRLSGSAASRRAEFLARVWPRRSRCRARTRRRRDRPANPTHRC